METNKKNTHGGRRIGAGRKANSERQRLSFVFPLIGNVIYK